MLTLSVLCVIVVFAVAEASLCTTPVHTICRKPFPNVEVKLPTDDSELKSSCRVEMDYIECLHSYDLACLERTGFAGIRPPLYYHRIKRFLDEACDEDSNLFHLLSRELQCINMKVQRKDRICGNSKRDILAAYDKYLKKNPIRGAAAKSLRTECLEQVATAACVLQKIDDDCGYLAYEAARDALSATQLMAYRCGLDMFEELQDVVPQLKIDSETKRNLQKQFVVEIE